MAVGVKSPSERQVSNQQQQQIERNGRRNNTPPKQVRTAANEDVRPTRQPMIIARFYRLRRVLPPRIFHWFHEKLVNADFMDRKWNGCHVVAVSSDSHAVHSTTKKSSQPNQLTESDGSRPHCHPPVRFVLLLWVEHREYVHTTSGRRGATKTQKWTASVFFPVRIHGFSISGSAALLLVCWSCNSFFCFMWPTKRRIKSALMTTPAACNSLRRPIWQLRNWKASAHKTRFSGLTQHRTSLHGKKLDSRLGLPKRICATLQPCNFITAALVRTSLCSSVVHH